MASVPSRNRSWWLTGPGLAFLLGLVASAWAWWLIALPVIMFEQVGTHASHYGLLYVHVSGGSLMLFLGAANLYIGATRRHFRYHKAIGRTYLIGGMAGALAAAVLTLDPSHNRDPDVVLSNSTMSLLTLSAAWLATAGMAYRAVRNRRYDAHRDWMIRSYVLVWSFVFCRLVSRASAMGELDGFIWLSWVAPLIACELVLQWRAGGKQQASAQR